MRFSNDGFTWNAWEPYTTSKGWTLSAGDGLKTVYVQYQDQVGSVSSAYSDTIILDTLPPSGAIVINDGATYTPSPTVTLALSATDAGAGVGQMRFSDDGSTWSDWEAYAASRSWALPGGDGQKTVYVQYKDKWGRGSVYYSSTIILDTLPPSGAVAINGGASYTASPTVTLVLSATDAGSGVGRMRLSSDGTTWSEWEPYAASKNWTLTNGDGPKTVYVQYKDNWGRVSLSYEDKIILDTLSPTGTISINAGADYTPSPTVTLALSATDAGAGVGQVRFSNSGAGWSDWEAYAASSEWTLPEGDGLKTVYVQYKDNWGRVSTPYSSTITLDTVLPAGVISINDGALYTTSPTVTLVLTASDSGSGLAQMCISNDAPPGEAAPCEGYLAAKTWILSADDGVKKVYVAFEDKAGNRFTATASITLDMAAPLGSVLINNGAQATNVPTVTLTLSATDLASGVASVRVSNDGTSWSSWEPYVTLKEWLLPGSEGVKTVWVQFVDQVGNVSASFEDGIIFSSQPVPQADFYGTPTSGPAPLSVTFTNTSSGDFATCTWDFGDDGGSSQCSPTHTYAAAGTYTVSLTVSGPAGVDVETKDGYIVVTSSGYSLYLPLAQR